MAPGATISDKADGTQGWGQKFWNTILLFQTRPTIYKRELLDKTSLWKTLYGSSNVLNDNNKKDKFKEYFEYTWKAELGVFDYFDYIIQMMETNNNIEWNPAFITKNNIELSKEIIDYDKTKVKEPKSGMDDFKVNKKDYIWSDIFIKKEANYKSDYDAWITAKTNDPSTLGSVFRSWSKIMANGETEFMAHSDAYVAINAWSIPTTKLEAEYDVITPTWDNWKLLWAKETHTTWATDSGHFHTWFNSKKQGDGSFKISFLAATLLEPITLARMTLDADGNYTNAEKSAHLNADFTNKAWWLVKLYIDETTTAPTEFSNWLALNPSLARREVIDIIDNDYDKFKTEAQTIYKNAVADHLAGYKLWRDAISDADQLADYRVLQEAIDKHAEYVRNFSP